MSRGNEVTMALALNRISALFDIFFKILFATYSLDKCLPLCEVSQKSLGGISRYLGISIEKGLNYACWT